MREKTNNTINTARQQAIEWQVILWSGEVTTEEKSAFAGWLQTQPENQQAWQWLQHASEPLQHAPENITSTLLRQQMPSLTRRKLLLSIGLLGSLTTMGYGIQKTPHWHMVHADFATARGQRQSITLADSTEISLNTDTSIDVAYSESERLLHLYAGEIMVITAKDNTALSRPFIIKTSAGQIRPVGTRFSVRQHDDQANQTQIQVFEGAVVIQPYHGASTQISAGEQLTFSKHQTHSALPVDSNSNAWVQGLLVVERQKLSDVITELSRYRSGVLRCDPAVADLVVSGVYPLDDTDAILQSLQHGLPIKISRVTRYWITVTAA